MRQNKEPKTSIQTQSELHVGSKFKHDPFEAMKLIVGKFSI